MTVKDYTQGTSLGAERLLYNLYRANPSVLFSPIFLDYLSSRTEDWLPLSDDIWFAKTVTIAHNGTSGLLQLIQGEEIQKAMEDPKAVWLLRVLLDGLVKNVEKEKEEGVLKAMWSVEPATQGIVPALTDHLSSVAEALKSATFTSFTQLEEARLSDLFIVFRHLLYLIAHFGALFQPLSRVSDQITIAILHYRIASSSLSHSHVNASSLIMEESMACDTALEEFVRLLRKDGLGEGPSWRVLKVLLGWAVYPATDPVDELKQVEYILDILLPKPGQMEENEAECQVWGRRIVGQLPLFQGFLRRLAESRSVWIQRLIDIDNGAAGVDEFLLMEEIAQLQLALDRLQEADPNHPLDYALQFQIYMSFKCLHDLVQSKGEQIVRSLTSGQLGERLARCYAGMSGLRLHDDSSASLAKHLVQSKQKHLIIAGVCAFLRQARFDNDMRLMEILGILKANGGFTRTDMGILVEEIGFTLAVLSTRPELSTEDAKGAIGLLEWLSSNYQEASMPTLSYASFQALQTLVQASIGADASNLAALGAELRFGGDEPMDDGNLNVVVLYPHSLTPAQMRVLIETEGQPRTPPRVASHPALGLVTTSPPTSVTRSPISQPLTKTYLNNDFRQVRNLARLNTSRPPSVHVDVSAFVVLIDIILLNPFVRTLSGWVPRLALSAQ